MGVVRRKKKLDIRRFDIRRYVGDKKIAPFDY